MADRPILFSAPMVRALLDGRKTQTRRLLKLRGFRFFEHGISGWRYEQSRRKDGDMDIVGCGPLCTETLVNYLPYGVGDRLWVREDFCFDAGLDDEPPRNFLACTPIKYLADETTTEAPAGWSPFEKPGRRRASMHMPRRFSRLTLVVTEVQVQRLQAMEGQHPSESDAIAEGVYAIHHGDGAYYYSAFSDEVDPKNWCDPTNAFAELWDHINGPGAWAANPWVVAISFTVHPCNIDSTEPAPCPAA